MQALRFQRKGDLYGKLFSVVQWVAKLFPDSSDYTDIRGSSNKLHAYFNVSKDEKLLNILIDIRNIELSFFAYFLGCCR